MKENLESMRSYRLLAIVLSAVFASGASAAPKTPTVPLVIISIDGLRPDHVLEADRLGLRVPELRRLLAEGSHASGVRGVVPTVTYPSHTTLVTGVSPAIHGIFANHPFDPEDRNSDGWNWYAEDIKVKTLWDAAADAGLVAASVDWPVTVGARIRWNVPQFWRAGTVDDGKLSRALSTPGLVAEIERAVGPWPTMHAWPALEEWTIDDDRQRARFDRYILENKKPDLHLAYLTSLDEAQHNYGPKSAEAFATLEAIDGLVGEIRAAAEKRTGGRPVYLAIVSDHGFVRTEKALELSEALREAGLLSLDGRGRITSWRACAWASSGSAAIMLHDSNDAEARSRVEALLRDLAADPENGIDRILSGAEVKAAGGFPDAAFIVGMRPDRRIGRKLEAPVLDVKVSYHGDHGFLPDNPEMDSTFILVGPGITAGRDFGRIDMRDIAPTLAGLLHLSLPAAEGRDLLKVSPRATLPTITTSRIGTTFQPCRSRCESSP